MTARSEDPLTRREHQVMALVMDGATDTEIAQRLELSPRTVANYVHTVCQKFKARNRTAAAVKYVLHYGIPTREQAPPPRTAPLTPQEQRVIALVAQGQTDQEIAEQLGLSQTTVGQHLVTIRRKFDVPNRVAAAVEYYRRGGRSGHGEITGSGDTK
jgi:DNA-binding CsgD family transcriptional regulator